MIFGIVLTSVLVVFALLFVFLTAPCKKNAAVKPFLSVRYAHRGLHGEGVAENSLTAFRLAVEAGFGIELDVRVSRDGEVVVVHDADLSRVCGTERRVRDMTAEELASVRLLGTEDGVPTLREVLTLVDGRVPLLIEIKEDTAADRDVVPRLLPLLAPYKGPILIESFNPLSLARIKELLPTVARGLLCDHYTKKPEYKKPTYHLLQWFLLNFKAKPDFYAYNYQSRTYLPFRLVRMLHKRPTLAWTVRTQLDKEICRESGFSSIIFEDFIPKEDNL